MMNFFTKLDREQFGIRRAVNQTEYESLVALYQLDARTGNCSTNQQFEEYSDASEFPQHQLIYSSQSNSFPSVSAVCACHTDGCNSSDSNTSNLFLLTFCAILLLANKAFYNPHHTS